MKYFISFFLLLVVEIAIAYFHIHPFIRYFVGDVLVIPLLYCFVRIFFSSEKIALGVLLFAFLTETLQFFNIVEILGIQSKLLRIVIGTTYSFWDLVAYLLGYYILIFSEKISCLKRN